jgi:hypothetical protein
MISKISKSGIGISDTSARAQNSPQHGNGRFGGISGIASVSASTAEAQKISVPLGLEKKWRFWAAWRAPTGNDFVDLR